MHGFSKVFLKKKSILTKTFKSSSQNNGLFLDPIIKMWLFFIKEIEATNPHYLFTKQSKTYEGSLVLTVTRPPYSVLKMEKKWEKTNFAKCA